MNYLATITSKRQLTIPSKLFKKVGFSEGDKVILEEKEGEIMLKSAASLIEKLAGSVKVPRRFRGMDTDEMIRKAKEEYFREKYMENK